MDEENRILLGKNKHAYIIKLEGNLRFNLSSAVELCINKILNAKVEEVIVDLTAAKVIDSTILGLIAKLIVDDSKVDTKPILLVSNTDIIRTLTSVSFDSFFKILQVEVGKYDNFIEISTLTETEHQLAARILQAHKYLLEISDNCDNQFFEVVKCFENSLSGNIKHF